MSLAEKGSCIQALVIINTALTLHGQVDYNAELYKRKASCLIELGRLGEAKQALDAAKKIFISIPELTNTRWQLEVLKISANLAHAYHDDKQAYLLMNEFHQKSTKLQLKNSSERLIKVRSALEIDRRDTEISLLHQRAKVQALLMEKKRQQVNSQHYFIIVIVIFIILILIFLLAQHKYTRRLLAISVHDSLSGLFNRKYIFDFLEKTITATSLKKGNLAVILLDIDDFKHANDHYGHPFGDQVIKQISTICQTTLRNEDVVGRIGGEEFLCVLPRTDQRESKRIAQRMLYNIAQHSFLTKSGEYYSTTVSIGIANITPKTSNSTELYVQADKALYHAKHLGKNLIISYQDIADKVG